MIFSGIADLTLFTLSCSGWTEYDVTTQNLKYEYRIREFGKSVEYLFYYGVSAESTPSVLPTGNVLIDFINEARLLIIDTLGDYYIFTANVTVISPTFKIYPLQKH